mmetsp:Transcript_10412/g.26969  ORF Transcript_10412/g.26969 Transcript_10412/m.26969 type:complete len:250 (+) Transcript_10412:286-1035(+)
MCLRPPPTAALGATLWHSKTGFLLLLLLLLLLLCHLPPLQPPVVKRPDRQRAPSSPTQRQKQQHCQLSGRPRGTGASWPAPPPQSNLRNRPCAVPTQARKTAQCLTRMPPPWKRSQPRLQPSQLPDLVARVLMQRRAEHQRAGARRGRQRRHRSEKRCGGRLFGALLKPAGCPGVDETDFPTWASPRLVPRPHGRVSGGRPRQAPALGQPTFSLHAEAQKLLLSPLTKSPGCHQQEHSRRYDWPWPCAN